MTRSKAIAQDPHLTWSWHERDVNVGIMFIILPMHLLIPSEGYLLWSPPIILFSVNPVLNLKSKSSNSSSFSEYPSCNLHIYTISLIAQRNFSKGLPSLWFPYISFYDQENSFHVTSLVLFTIWSSGEQAKCRYAFWLECSGAAGERFGCHSGYQNNNCI